MNPGLLLLVRRGAWAKLRFLARRARTLKGGLAIGAGVVFLAAIVATQFWGAALSRQEGKAPPTPEEVLAYLPAILLVVTLLGALSGRSLYFTRPEVDFLFPAPVGRRELLVYSLLARLDIQVLSGLWTALFVLNFAPVAAAAALALVLAFVFMYTTAQALALAAAAAEPWLPRHARRLIALGLAAAALAVVASAVAAAPPGAELGERVARVVRHPLVRGASVVTRPFAELFVAATWGGALLWTAASLGVIAAEVGLMLAFDVAYTERSLAVSRRVHERLRRMRSGGSTLGAAPSLRRVRLPALPFLGAAEPLARRQALELARTPKVLLPPVIMGAIWLTAILVGAGAGEAEAASAATTAIVVGIVFPVLFTAHVGFDFRRDLDRMPLLKSLPLRPFAVAVGQVFTVAVVFAVLQLAMAAGVA
ncbi:MAG TPA: putative ABC exporter domain-containing protein, partial [Longimicrobiaceae bacterium]|nr:putative ABC exporter domain-containing protein [Longimicrobiaceae bacterium]